MKNLLARFSHVSRVKAGAVLVGLIATFAATSASAETLMMPKRDALKGTSVVVWGVHTQAGTPACSINFGDGSPAVNCTGADRSYIATNHTYTASGTFTATLTVGAETATVAVQVIDGAILTAENMRGLKINMAIQDGLRYLWTTQDQRAANFPGSVTTSWTNGWRSSEAALITLAFENHGYRLANDGSAPTGLYEKYVVRRGLNYVMQSLTGVAISSQASGIGGQPVRDPCVGAGIEASPCIGLRDTRQDTFHASYTTAVAMLPLAASGALNRVNNEVDSLAPPTNEFCRQLGTPCPANPTYTVMGKTYGEILQRATNGLAWGQIDNGTGRGGWYYGYNGNINDSGFQNTSDGSTIGWDLLAMFDAEAAGITVPAWVKSEFAFGLTAGLNNDGTLDYSADGNAGSNNNVGPQKNGIGLQGLFFIGETTGARVNAVKAAVSSWWNGGGGTGGNSWGGCSNLNYGCGYTMFNNFKGLKLQGIQTLPGVTRPAGPGSIVAGDWYADYQDWLVNNQTSPTSTLGGSWDSMGFSCCNSGQTLTAAIAELILSPVALVLPDETKFSTVGLTPATATGLEGTSHTVTAKAESTGGTPVAGATVVFTVTAGPNAGVSGSATTDSTGKATFTYTDPIGKIGTDTIRATIGSLTSNNVTMVWTPLNRAPIAVNDSATTHNAVTIDVLSNDSDPDHDPLTLSIQAGAGKGSLVINADNTITYTPNAGALAGSDSFVYKINDGHGGTATATVNITITNAKPTTTPFFVSTHGEPVTLAVLSHAGDTDGDTVSLLGACGGFPVPVPPNPGPGTCNFDVAAGTVTFTPNPQWFGPSVQFGYTVTDGRGGNTQSFINVAYVNKLPIPGHPTFTTTVNTDLQLTEALLLAGSSDPDGDEPTIEEAPTALHGVIINNGDDQGVYRPNTGFIGVDTISFFVEDDHGGKVPTTATVTVTAPTVTTILAPSIVYGANGVITVTVSSGASSAPTGSLSLSIAGGPAQTQALVNGSATFTMNGPAAGDYALSASYTGQDFFLSSSGTGNLHVDKASSETTVTCSPTSTVYNGAPQQLCAASVTGVNLSQTLPVNYTDNTNVGTVTASASYSGDANHTGSSDSENFSITKAPSVTAVTCSVTSVIYNGSPFTPCSANVTGIGGLVQTLTVFYTANVNVGTATASASYGGDANHTGSSDSKTFKITGAYGNKADVLAEMRALRATVTDKEDGKKLDEAIDRLAASLNPALWRVPADGVRLNLANGEYNGEKAIELEKQAVEKLEELIKSKKSALSDAMLQGWVNRITAMDRLLAVTQINDAIAGGGDAKKIAEALKRLADGDARNENDKRHEGIEHYKNAWKQAVEALKKS